MRPGDRLDESVWDLLHQAMNLYQDDPRAATALHHQFSRFEQPLRIAVAGAWRSGKSTVVNAIMGEEVGPVEVEDGRQVFTWYEDSPTPEVTAYTADGSAREVAVSRSTGGMRVDLARWQADQVDDIVVKWPTRALRYATLLDTPAATSADEDGRASITDRILRDADAMLYLTRDARGADIKFLQAVQEGPVARAAPINVIMVMSRADEIGGGRVDALLTARQLARRQHREPEVNSLCIGVVALAGLVGLTGRVLTEPDFVALATLAAAPRAELESFLLSADRFVGTEFPAPVDPEVRRALLDRLGIFGVRLATTLIRTGCDTRAKLAAELVRRSGLTELRESISRCFTDRADVLRARSALVTVESVLRKHPRPGSRELLTWVEYVLATTHDFRELRLLAALQDPQLGFDAELTAEAQRLVGGNGVGLTARLGIDHDPGGAELWGLSSQALRRWQSQAEDPLLSLDQRRAAGVVVRSCEAMLAQLSAR
jgi:hypothetical protein